MGNDIKIPVKSSHNKNSEKFKHEFKISVSYHHATKMKNVMKEITESLNKICCPIKLEIVKMNIWSDDTEKVDKITPHSHLINKSITDYRSNGLHINVTVKPHYHHNIKSQHITCKYMTKLNSRHPVHCPIYYRMKESYEWNENNLHHLTEFSHFMDEYAEKQQCRYKEKCKAYVRLEKGGNKLNDRCHIKLFRHPPRTRNIKLAENINSLIINKSKTENHSLSYPTDDDEKQYNFTVSDGYLNALISEVISNGFKNDLCLECEKHDECKHDEYSILNIVDDKLNHIRHKAIDSPLRRDHMLSLILYTGCDCNYDLCKSQRNGDYDKWKWFDYCLYQAIFELSRSESGSFSVFSGLKGVKIDKNVISSGYFVTYVSTSWHKEVAKSFIGEDDAGLMLQIDKQYKNDKDIYCCDVSWISKFPDECEVLFARALQYKGDQFQCCVLDDANGLQTVSLRKN